MRNVPKLRFKEFCGEWEEKRLYEIAKKITDKNIENKINIVLTNSAEKGIIKQEDFFDKEIANEKNIDTYYVVEKDSFVYNPRISKLAPYGPINRNHLECGVVSPLYLVFDVKKENRNFIEKYFKTSCWFRYMYNVGNSGARSDRMNISNNDFFDMSLFIPNLQEQQKIADFLSSIDKKISITEEKLDLFKDYKKGIMQKIFNQELRFKDSNNNDYPEWEEKRLGDIGEIITGKTPSTKDEKNWKGEIQFVTPTDINDNKYQNSTQRNVAEEINIKILPIGTIMFTCIASIGKMAISTKKCITNQQINSIIVNKNIHNEYIYYALLNLVPKIQASQSTTTLPIINKTEFSKFIIKLPCLEEQEKIANFLSSIDNKIDNLATKLEDLKEFKKGLLQRMFV